MGLQVLQHDRKTVVEGNNKINTYDFNKVNKVATLASDEIETFLLAIPDTEKVTNVEKEKIYQNADIDLLWYVRSRKDNQIVKKSLEIKGDRYYHTGNYFFETISNSTKNTPGCFMITEADFIFYYFVDQKELHILPTSETRDWFIKNELRFQEAKTSTSAGNKLLYTSFGRKVPIKTAREECDISVIDLRPFI